MRLKTFAEYLANQDLGSEPHTEAVGPVNEAFSEGFVKSAAVGIMMKIAQMRQTVLKDGTANQAQKSLANMLFLLASMVAVSIGGMSRDAELINRVKNSTSR